MPKISVILPTWNRANIIEKALKSALNQTIDDLEVLVCDDCSTDNTFLVISSMKDPRVKWVPGERGGRPAIPRNRGIKKIKGEWIAFLDSDDEWLPKKIEKQLETAYRLNCNAVCSNAFRLSPNKGIEMNLINFKKKYINFMDLFDTNRIVCSSVLIHNSIINYIGNFPECPELTGLEDFSLWLRIATQTDFAYIDEPLLIYYDDPQNSIRSEGSRNVWIQRKFVFRDFLNWAKVNGINKNYISKARKGYLYAIWRLKKKELFGFKRIIRKVIE